MGRLLEGRDPGLECGDGIGPQERRALDQVQAIIATGLDADLTLAALARRVGLGVSRLKKLYQRRYGTPVRASKPDPENNLSCRRRKRSRELLCELFATTERPGTQCRALPQSACTWPAYCRFDQEIYSGEVQAVTAHTVFGVPNTLTYGFTVDQIESSRPRTRSEVNLITGVPTFTVAVETFQNKNFPKTGSCVRNLPDRSFHRAP